MAKRRPARYCKGLTIAVSRSFAAHDPVSGCHRRLRWVWGRRPSVPERRRSACARSYGGTALLREGPAALAIQMLRLPRQRAEEAARRPRSALRAAMIQGGDSGEAALVPGQPDKSLLFLAATRKNPDLAMPPKAEDRLSAEQLDLLETVDRRRGALAAHDEDRVGGPGRRRHRGDQRRPDAGVDATQVSARRLVGAAADTPAGVAEDRQAARIDSQSRSTCSFRMDLSRRASRPWRRRRTLSTFLRRATFDLTGLPPTVAELDAFLQDGAAGAKPQAAYEELIDRLLASPRYGEQQARHWLDVVRYADTAGFSNDFERPQRLALSRLRHPQLQRRQAVRPLRHSSSSPATSCDPSSDPGDC